jgi:DNA-binding MarR family transcriptional regulator
VQARRDEAVGTGTGRGQATGAGPAGTGTGHQVSVQGRAWRSLVEITHALLRELERELVERVGLNLQQYDVMLHISEGNGGRRMTELADAVVLSKSGLTSLVDRMEAEGLLERRPDPDDRRATRVVLSRHGKALFREASSAHREVVHRIFVDRVSGMEAKVIADVLERVRRELEAHA